MCFKISHLQANVSLEIARELKIKYCADMVFGIVLQDGEDVGSANAFVMRVWRYRLAPEKSGSGKGGLLGQFGCHSRFEVAMVDHREREESKC